MNLINVKSAFPPYYYTQSECLRAMRGAKFWGEISGSSRNLLEKVLGGDSGIDGRYFCLDDLEKAWRMDAQELSEYYEAKAPELAAQAVKKALDDAGIEARDLDALFLCSCTGYLCPGVSSHVAELLGLRANVFHQDMTGLGCGAAVPVMRCAKGYILDNPDSVIATVAVEVCSAAFYVENDVGVLISTCLFGDGAAAALWCGNDFQHTDSHKSSVKMWKADHFESLHIPEEREKIRFTNAKGKLRNQLHRSVPELAGETVRELYAIARNTPQRWITHGGGRDVIEQLERVLPPEKMDYARTVMSKYGNLSSPSVLIALEMCLDDINANEDIDSLWICSFGAGFSAHSCELWR